MLREQRQAEEIAQKMRLADGALAVERRQLENDVLRAQLGQINAEQEASAAGGGFWDDLPQSVVNKVFAMTEDGNQVTNDAGEPLYEILNPSTQSWTKNLTWEEASRIVAATTTQPKQDDVVKQLADLLEVQKEIARLKSDLSQKTAPMDKARLERMEKLADTVLDNLTGAGSPTEPDEEVFGVPTTRRVTINPTEPDEEVFGVPTTRRVTINPTEPGDIPEVEQPPVAAEKPRLEEFKSVMGEQRAFDYNQFMKEEKESPQFMGVVDKVRAKSPEFTAWLDRVLAAHGTRASSMLKQFITTSGMSEAVLVELLSDEAFLKAIEKQIGR